MPELKDKLFNKLTSWIKMNIDKRYWPSVNPDYNPKNESRDIPFLDKFSNL